MTTLQHKFVECIPDNLDEGVLYISISHGTAVHRCCCGCHLEVVTPLTPTDWKLIFDGESVSLYPSIGNWSFPCSSHYWITHNRLEWAEDWADWRVAAAEEKDIRHKEKFNDIIRTNDSTEPDCVRNKKRRGFWTRFWKSW